MTLLEYIKTFKSTSELADFAGKCETSVGQLKQIAYKNRRAGESLAINIERESGGAVTCNDLRPDVDWEYLRNTNPAA